MCVKVEVSMNIQNNVKSHPSFGAAVIVKFPQGKGCACQMDYEALNYAVNVMKAIGKEGTIPVAVPDAPKYALINGVEKMIIEPVLEMIEKADSLRSKVKATALLKARLVAIEKSSTTKKLTYEA